MFNSEYVWQHSFRDEWMDFDRENNFVTEEAYKKHLVGEVGESFTTQNDYTEYKTNFATMEITTPDGIRNHSIRRFKDKAKMKFYKRLFDFINREIASDEDAAMFIFDTILDSLKNTETPIERPEDLRLIIIKAYPLPNWMFPEHENNLYDSLTDFMKGNIDRISMGLFAIYVGAKNILEQLSMIGMDHN